MKRARIKPENLVLKRRETMEKIILGRTGLEVTTMGLGCGGKSRIGMFTKGLDHAASIVRLAYDSGVRFFDTAEAYGTQPAVGKGLEGLDRSSYVISTKYPFFDDETRHNPKKVEPLLDKALIELKTDYIDIYHIHGVTADDYLLVKEEFYPELLRMQAKGKLRNIGITERFAKDTNHTMAAMALKDDLFDVIMLGYNMLNFSAQKDIFKLTKAQNVGTLCMFAVRNAMSKRQYERELLERLVNLNQISKDDINIDEGLIYLVNNGYANTVMEAAYRFCTHSDGIDVTLFGTSSPKHLKENMNSLTMPPLSREALDWIEKVFARVDSISAE